MAVCIGSVQTTNLPKFCLEILLLLLHLTNFLPTFHILLVSSSLIWLPSMSRYTTVSSGPKKVYDIIYLLTAIGLSPGGRNTVHIYTKTIYRTTQNEQYIEQHNNWKSAGRAPSWLLIPWHLPYNRGKSTENLS